jgi:DNA-binding transcriptional LysR family regulator
MGAPAPVLRDHLPAIMPQVRKKFPGLRLMLREASQSQAEAYLNQQEIDFAVTVIEGKTGPGITAEPLIELPLILLASTETKWRTAEDVLQQDQIAESLISLAPHESMVRRFQEYLTGRRIGWATSLEVSSLDLVDVYVAGGFGVGLSCQLPGVAGHPAAADRRAVARTPDARDRGRVERFQGARRAGFGQGVTLVMETLLRPLIRRSSHGYFSAGVRETSAATFGQDTQARS